MRQNRSEIFFKFKTLIIGILPLSICYCQIFCQETQMDTVPSKMSGTDCKEINDCLRCVHVNNSCVWFIFKNECRKVVASDESDDVVVSKNFPDEIHKKGSFHCPRITSTQNVYAPSSRHTKISVRIFPGSVNIYYSKFSCHIGDGPDVIKKNCVILGNMLYCDSVEFTYSTNEPFVKYPLKVFWGTNEFSNPRNLSVIVYKCHKMADNCKSCLSLNQNYECGWCPSSSTCEIVGQCEETSVSTRWIGRQSLCPELSQ